MGSSSQGEDATPKSSINRDRSLGGCANGRRKVEGDSGVESQERDKNLFTMQFIAGGPTALTLPRSK